MKNTLMLLVLAAILMIPGCSKKPSVEIKEWAQFQDQIFKISFNYPKGWFTALDPTKVTVSSSEEVAEKFFDHDPRKADGVQIIVASYRGDNLKDNVAYMEDFKNTKTSEGFSVGPIEDAKIEGLDAKKVTYYGAYDEQTKIKAVFMTTMKDSTIYYLQYAAFNDFYDPYIFVFDSVLSSLRLPRKVVIEKGVDPAIPVAQTDRFSDDYIQLEYPANFATADVPKKGDIVSSVRFIGNRDGSRQDCTIDIDIRPAKKLTLDKVVAQNSKFFNVTSRGETRISGEKSVFLNYNPKVRNVASRIYFVVKNDRIYRIILNYYVPMKKDFLPAFEKVVASIRLK